MRLTLGQRILKEILVWNAAIAGRFLTFQYFEPLYGRVESAAIKAGYARVLGFDSALLPRRKRVFTDEVASFRGFRPLGCREKKWCRAAQAARARTARRS
jgi:hypothetical protein